MNVAIVHDWLTGMRGGEKVLEQLCLLFPQAHIYTLLYSPENISSTINRLPIKSSFIQRLPAAKRRHQWYLPLFPAAIEKFDLTSYDLVISTSHCVAKGVITRPSTCHISYIHAPMRYAWDMYHQYFDPQQAGVISRSLIPLIMPRLRVWDRASADRVDYFIANSKHTARRISKYYRRDADVIYPPIDTKFFTIVDQPREDYFLVVSALVPYKRIELAITACDGLKLPLVIIGDGVEKTRLQAMASHRVKFLEGQSKEQIRKHYQCCRALLFPGEEDCGIVPLEAQSCGCPVIAFGGGGALETILEPVSGIFFAQQTTTSLMHAIERFMPMNFNHEHIHKAVLLFGEDSFRKKIKQFITKKLAQYGAGENIPHV